MQILLTDVADDDTKNTNKMLGIISIETVHKNRPFKNYYEIGWIMFGTQCVIFDHTTKRKLKHWTEC